MYEVIKNIEMPVKPSRSKYPFPKLEVGDGFSLGAGADTGHRLHSVVYAMKRFGQLPKTYKIQVRGGNVKRVA